MEYHSGTRHHGPSMLNHFALPPGKRPLFVGWADGQETWQRFACQFAFEPGEDYDVR